MSLLLVQNCRIQNQITFDENVSFDQCLARQQLRCTAQICSMETESEEHPIRPVFYWNLSEVCVWFVTLFLRQNYIKFPAAGVTAMMPSNTSLDKKWGSYCFPAERTFKREPRLSPSTTEPDSPAPPDSNNNTHCGGNNLTRSDRWDSRQCF